MTNPFVIFKSPNLRYREENFGGIAKLKLKTFILTRQQYSFLEKLTKVISFDKLNKSEKNIALKLIENDLLLKVDLEKAKQLGFKE